MRAREGAVRARACVGVHLCVCACKRECLSPSLARHAPLLLSSSTRASTLPLILEMRSSSPGPQYASLVLLCLTRPSCRAPFLLCDRAVQRLCAGDLSLARVRRTRPRGRPGRGGRSTSTRSQVRDLCACARARACVRACVRLARRWRRQVMVQLNRVEPTPPWPHRSPRRRPCWLPERKRTSWLRRPATCFPPLWPCSEEAPIYSLA